MRPLPRRAIYAVFLGLTIAFGLFSRSDVVSGTSFFGKYAGDTLWSLAVFWGVAIVSPSTKSKWLLVATLVISLVIELSQLYHAPWIDEIRANKFAALILGNTFIWSDLACYAVGAFLGALIDWQTVRKERQSPWHWWLTSTMKDKLLVVGGMCLGVNGILITMSLIEMKTLATGIAFLFIGFILKSEDSTDI